MSQTPPFAVDSHDNSITYFESSFGSSTRGRSVAGDCSPT
jgi:hypothetical protein